MIKPDAKYIEWIERYQIQPKSLECPECKKEFPLNVPIAMKGYRGLEMQEHGCEGGQPFVVVPVDADTIELWERLRP
jgi:hypothetical protein